MEEGRLNERREKGWRDGGREEEGGWCDEGKGKVTDGVGGMERERGLCVTGTVTGG